MHSQCCTFKLNLFLQDDNLRTLVQKLGPNDWKRVASYLPVSKRCRMWSVTCTQSLVSPWLILFPSRCQNRSEPQCQHRWFKVLDPDLVKGPWTKEEDEKVRCSLLVTGWYFIPVDCQISMSAWFVVILQAQIYSKGTSYLYKREEICRHTMSSFVISLLFTVHLNSDQDVLSKRQSNAL